MKTGVFMDILFDTVCGYAVSTRIVWTWLPSMLKKKKA